MNRVKKLLSITLCIIAVLCLLAAAVLVVRYCREDSHTNDILEDFHVSAEQLEPTQAPFAAVTASPDVPALPDETVTAAPSAEPTAAPVENPYADKFLANRDMAAWLVIPGTNIDYPVMWTPADEEYYLYRGFDGSSNSNGCLILDTDSSLEPLTTNQIIHGHNMKSGAMFGKLTEYKKEDYYKEHKEIILHTKACQRNYEVIAVFYSQVYKKSDDVFKFYKFFQADTEEEFEDFYSNIKSLSLYDTGVTAEFGDRFITLSTCTYHVTNGRFVVIGKEIESGDTYLPIE